MNRGENMKQGYRIKEIAKLYGVCADTLRYYEEQGILTPERGENNYRIYSIQDICNLNVIREQRELGIPMERIREYITGRQVESTLAMMSEEEEIVERQIARLVQAKQDLARRKKDIRDAVELKADTPRMLTLEARTCYQLSDRAIQDANMDFMLKKLEKRHEAVLQALDSEKIAGVLDSNALKKGKYDRFTAVLLIVEGAQEWDRLLPAGEYASIVYRGAYSQQGRAVRQLLDFVKRKRLKPLEAPIEIYHIDAHETLLQEEYVTEIQVLVKQAEN